jgi:hypothetical protein
VSQTKPHLTARVVCAESGEDLDAPPSYTLWSNASRDPEQPLYARHHSGEYLYVEFRDLNWHKRHGHEPRLVKVRNEPECVESSRHD